MSTVESKVGTPRFRPTTEEEPKPAKPAQSKRRGLGLCLSGGGYRATLYHLGAARRLYELGILKHVDTISSVSGGGIFAALLADLAIRRGWKNGLDIKNFDLDVAAPVRNLTRRDLRTTSLIWPGHNARHVERLLDPYLHSARLRDLPERPDFIICATDLTHGINFEFSRSKTGSYKFKNPEGAAEWPLAFAVATSACFPPWFGPVPVRGRLRRALRKGGGTGHGEESLRYTDLTDGGLYDNLAIQPVWESHAQLLVSDGSAPLQETRISRRPVKRLMRYTSIAGRQARHLRVSMFIREVGRRKLIDGAFWDIGTSERVPVVGYSKKVIDDSIALIRTDLNRFSREEQMILENHGYWSVEDQFRRKRIQDRLDAIICDDPPDAKSPHEDWMNEDRVRHALRESHKRFSLRRMLDRV